MRFLSTVFVLAVAAEATVGNSWFSKAGGFFHLPSPQFLVAITSSLL